MPFVSLGSASQAPSDGELARYDPEGTPVAVANVGGTLYAFGDTCTHKQCSLAAGDLHDTHVVCACHKGTFEVTTGAVIAEPPPGPVPTYPVRIEDGQLQIEL